MHSDIRQNPDGSISFHDERYRIKETGDHRFNVVREADGLSVGALHLLPSMRVEVEGEHRELVEAIADMLASPRGALPLQ